MTTYELYQDFIKNYALRRLRPSTVRGYCTNFKLHILPCLGNKRIEEITPADLDNMESKMTICNKSKIYVHASLRKALNYAIKRDYLVKNPYLQFDLPQIEAFKYQTLPEDEIRRMLQTIKGTNLEIPVTLALCYGLRRGECLGIRHTDIDEKNNVLHIQRTVSREKGQIVTTPCKTEKSNRFILLQKKHTALLMSVQEPIIKHTPCTIDQHFANFCKKNNFPKIRFHDLRHSYATYMLIKGIHPKIVSTVLGHSKISTTLDIYSHPDITLQKQCINIFEEFIGN